MMSVFSIALGKEDVDDETKAEIASFTKSIYQLHPAELGAIIEKLPADQASTLIRHVQ
jgi:Mg/Co/Ni transporter MgtE